MANGGGMDGKKTDWVAKLSAVSTTISDTEFTEFISERSKYLLSVANHVPKHQLHFGGLTRPLLGRLMLQAIEIHELLDTYGAKNNRRWRRFRHCVTTIRVFADVGCELLHIRHALPGYRLIRIERDFLDATEEALAYVCTIVLEASTQILEEATDLGLDIPHDHTSVEVYEEALPPGRLPHDVETRKIDNVYETVTLLATAFLNLSEETRSLRGVSMPEPDDCCHFKSDVLNQETLCNLEDQFHNLQSLYDTYVCDTDVEDVDSDLLVLRGHISVAMHLLSVGCSLAGYFQRYVYVAKEGSADSLNSLVRADELLQVLIRYAIGYTVVDTLAARDLCHSMLKRYVEETAIDVSIPVYRGFHVRPSTLTASIAQHYGTDVRMELGDETVNVAIPLELFRINEKINAQKRRFLDERIAQLNLAGEYGSPEFMRTHIQEALLKLAQEGLIVIYEQPLDLTEDAGSEDDILQKCTVNEVRRLLAHGKIDIRLDMTVKIIGDRRVLEDLRLLADSGYGEDQYGNNIPLPEKLSYLRR